MNRTGESRFLRISLDVLDEICQTRFDGILFQPVNSDLRPHTGALYRRLEKVHRRSKSRHSRCCARATGFPFMRICGGGRNVLSLSIQNAEGQYALEPAIQLSPEMLFEKSWALTVLERTMGRLEAEMADKNKQKHFDCLKAYLTADKDATPYQGMAAELEITEGSVRVAVHRLRRRYRKLLRDEIAQTVGDEGKIDEEMGCLFAALAY